MQSYTVAAPNTNFPHPILLGNKRGGGYEVTKVSFDHERIYLNKKNSAYEGQIWWTIEPVVGGKCQKQSQLEVVIWLLMIMDLIASTLFLQGE